MGRTKLPKLTPNNMREHLWNIAHKIEKNKIEPNQLNAISKSYKTILAIVAEERKMYALLDGKIKDNNLFLALT